MARVKNIEAYCNFCNSLTKMELAGEASTGDNSNKRWAKCKKCKQMMLIDLNTDVREKKPSLEGIENQDCKVYSPKESFDVGDNIFHKSWNDFGKVISKETLSNGRSSISVEFQKLGNKKLIESLVTVNQLAEGSDSIEDTGNKADFEKEKTASDTQSSSNQADSTAEEEFNTISQSNQTDSNESEVK